MVRCFLFAVVLLLLTPSEGQTGIPSDTTGVDTTIVGDTAMAAQPLEQVSQQNGDLREGAPIDPLLVNPIEDWLLWLYLGQFLAIGVVKFLFPPLLQQLGRNIINFNIAFQSYRYRESEPTAIDLVLRINALLTFALMISFSLQHWFGLQPDWELLGTVAVFFIAFYFFRKLVNVLFGSIFSFGEVLNFTNFYSDYLIKGIGIAGFPFLWVFSFGSGFIQEITFYIFILLLGTFVIVRFLRGLKAGAPLFLGNGFHFILYICTLEIIPLLLICKVFAIHYKLV